MAANAIATAADITRENIQWTLAAYEAPSVLFRPKLFIDGDQWCALYGDNLQEGVSGFGISPEKAMHDFDKNWKQSIDGGQK